jgi:hypothetical protein
MKTETAETILIKVYISGPIEAAKQLLRAECLENGLCVTVEPTLFIYTGGEESGYVVGLLNYPRFPSDLDALVKRATQIALRLLYGTFQHSVLVVTPASTFWLTQRESDSTPQSSAEPK